MVSTNRMNLLNAANQVSKSSTLIRKDIILATEPGLWPILWPHMSRSAPSPFWYFYPSKDIASAEFEDKWVEEFLPKVDPKHPQYGWKHFIKYQQIHSIKFNTGVTIYFKSYEQKGSNIQSQSLYKVSCDEEMPQPVYDELKQRISATRGYFDQVFTATLGQKFWYDAMELRGKSRERFPNAFKQQISKRDCLFYMDGTESPWTEERIREEELECSSEQQRRIRIDGRFGREENVFFHGFDETAHVFSGEHCKAAHWYAGVFIGQYTGLGGFVVLGVNNDHTKAFVDASYFTEKREESAASIFMKFKQASGEKRFSGCWGNVGARDFIKITASSPPYFESTTKPPDCNEKLINSLFKSNLLKLRAGNDALSFALSNTSRKNDELKNAEVLGALVMCASNVPWNYSKILGLVSPNKEKPKAKPKDRWSASGLSRLQVNDTTADEFNQVNHLYGADEGYYDIEESF